MADKGHKSGENNSRDSDREVKLITDGKSGWTGGGVSNFENASDKAKR